MTAEDRPLSELPPPERLRLVLRGNYPNTWTRLLARNEAGRDRTRHPGYLPPEVEYGSIDGGLAGTMTVRELDVPLLNHPDPSVGNRHLARLVRARAGDPAARSVAEAVVGPLREDYTAFSRDLRLIHSDFVVPSYTDGAYDDARISHKGANLLRHSQLGYPVPDFAILTSHCYRRPPGERVRHLADAVANLEQMTNRRLGSAKRPLVMAMRFALPECLPGLPRTYLNVGVTERTLPALARIYGPEPAGKMFLDNLETLAGLLGGPALDGPADERAGLLTPQQRGAAIDRLLETLRAADPNLVTDGRAQAAFLLEHGYRFFEESRNRVLTVSKGHDLQPSLILQQMICTVREGLSYPGVLHTRSPHSGRNRVVERVLRRSGDELTTGAAPTEVVEFADREEVRERLPAVYHFVPAIPDLEREHAASVTAEFAAEVVRRGRFFALLQLDASEMTGRAMLVAAMDLHAEGTISAGRVAELVRPDHLLQIQSPKIDEASAGALQRYPEGEPLDLTLDEREAGDFEVTKQAHDAYRKLVESLGVDDRALRIASPGPIS